VNKVMLRRHALLSGKDTTTPYYPAECTIVNAYSGGGFNATLAIVDPSLDAVPLIHGGREVE
jgi:hypothetical protein